MDTQILVVGATGLLGGAIVKLLRADGHRVRAVVRNPDRFVEFERIGAEPVAADLRDRASLDRACAGITHVITTANAFVGRGANATSKVDLDGNLRLIDAARASGVGRFIFVSAHIADEQSPVDLFRYKAIVEAYLQRSGMDWVAIRPGAFMEVWAEIVAGTLPTKGTATVFGKGDNPINFVAVQDVAQVIARVVTDTSVSREGLPVAGPENLTLNTVVSAFERHSGRTAKRKHVPPVALRTLGMVLRPVNPVLARMMTAGLLMAVRPQSMDTTVLGRRFDWWQPQSLDEWLAARPH